MSTTLDKNDGGPAFPHLHESSQRINQTEMHGGMTLRDYFAAKAMQGMMADHTRDNSPAEISEWAYKIADAMLKERSK
jgi:hypothetical protein